MSTTWVAEASSASHSAAGPSSALKIGSHVSDALAHSGFALPVPPGVAVVGTGGTLTTVRAVEAARRGVPLDQADALIAVPRLREILAQVGPMDLAARRQVPGLHAARADVFPAALATLLALAETGGIQAFQHSHRNLRWGLAAEYLG